MILLTLRLLYNGCLACALVTSVYAANFDVTSFGAVADGQTNATAAIQKAIDAAAPEGGTVVFRPGRYLTGALFLKSGMRMNIDRGTTLLGSQDLAAYPEMPTRVAGIEMKWPAALLNIYQQSHVEIAGEGTLDGQGKIWWDRYWALRKEYEPQGLRWAADYDCKRVRLLQVYQSSDVRISGLSLQRSGFWTVHICYSSRIDIEGLTIQNNIGGRGPSTDGIDIDSSNHVRIARCDIACNDDAICMKAGRDADGLRVDKPTENVIVRDCIIREGAAGITLGSETSGSIRNIDVAGLHVLSAVPKGICVKSAAVRGGTVENVKIGRLQLDGVAIPVSIVLNWNPSYSYAKIPPEVHDVPEYWRVLATPVPRDRGLPHVRNFEIFGITATGAKHAFEVEGFADAPILNMRFSDVRIQAATGGKIAEAENWICAGCRLDFEDGRPTELIHAKAVAGWR